MLPPQGGIETRIRKVLAETGKLDQTHTISVLLLYLDWLGTNLNCTRAGNCWQLSVWVSFSRSQCLFLMKTISRMSMMNFANEWWWWWGKNHCHPHWGRQWFFWGRKWPPFQLHREGSDPVSRDYGICARKKNSPIIFTSFNNARLVLPNYFYLSLPLYSFLPHSTYHFSCQVSFQEVYILTNCKIKGVPSKWMDKIWINTLSLIKSLYIYILYCYYMSLS